MDLNYKNDSTTIIFYRFEYLYLNSTIFGCIKAISSASRHSTHLSLHSIDRERLKFQLAFRKHSQSTIRTIHSNACTMRDRI